MSRRAMVFHSEELYRQCNVMKSGKNKYRNEPVSVNGRRFDSKVEARRYLFLMEMQSLGEITELELQPEYELIPAYRKKNGKAVRRITYRADFRYKHNGETVVEDVKGVETAEFKLKKKMVEYFYPDVEIRLVRANEVRKL